MILALPVTPNPSPLYLMWEKDLACDASHSILQDIQQQGSNHCNKCEGWHWKMYGDTPWEKCNVLAPLASHYPPHDYFNQNNVRKKKQGGGWGWRRQGLLQAVISKLSCFCLKVDTQQSSDKLGWYLISIRFFGMGADIFVWSLNNCTFNSSSHFEAVGRICSVNGASPSTVGEWKGSSTSPTRKQAPEEESAAQQDCQEPVSKGWRSKFDLQRNVAFQICCGLHQTSIPVSIMKISF